MYIRNRADESRGDRGDFGGVRHDNPHVGLMKHSPERQAFLGFDDGDAACDVDAASAYKDLVEINFVQEIDRGLADQRGAATLKQLVQAADNGIGIMAASGIEADNVADLLDRTGVREVHASLRSPVVDQEKVKKLLSAATNGSANSLPNPPKL